MNYKIILSVALSAITLTAAATSPLSSKKPMKSPFSSERPTTGYGAKAIEGSTPDYDEGGPNPVSAEKVENAGAIRIEAQKILKATKAGQKRPAKVTAQD